MVSRISAARSGSARPAARLRLVPCPGLARSSSREVIRADCPDRCLRAARRALRSRAPVTGRARTCRTACSPSARPAAAPASARSGASGSWLVDSGRMSGRASRSVPAGDGRAGRQRRPGRGGDGVRAGPGRLDGALDQAGREGAGHPQADAHPGGVAAGPGVLPAQVRLPVPPAGPGRAQQPGQVPPQRRRARPGRPAAGPGR